MQHKPITSKCQMRLASKAFSSPIKLLCKTPQLIPRGDVSGLASWGLLSVSSKSVNLCIFCAPLSWLWRKAAAVVVQEFVSMIQLPSEKLEELGSQRRAEEVKSPRPEGTMML